MSETDYFEIDFLAVEAAKSGDAITIRYQIDDKVFVHVVDGGFTDTGEDVLAHIDKYYGANAYIDNVVLTHSDGDHARGLKHVLENGSVGILWMNRPWLYAEELIDRFATYNSVDALKSSLRRCYPTVNDLEVIAKAQGIEIKEAFQGTQIGSFHVMSPTRATYLDLIVESEWTPKGIDKSNNRATRIRSGGTFAASWGEEVFSTEETSAENEMSVVQAAQIAGKTILLTGDTGRRGLQAVVDFAPSIGIKLPGIDRFQVPHHGSRRNVNSELLDQILGPRYTNQSGTPQRKFTALISSALEDTHHPRKSVERAMFHRGGFVTKTEGKSVRTSHNAPEREGWVAVKPVPYPTEQEQ